MEETNNSTISAGLGTITTETYNYINTLLTAPSVILLLFIIIIIYVAIFMVADNGSTNISMNNLTNSTNSTSSTNSSMTYILIVIFIVLIVINGFQYFLGIDVIAKIKNTFSKSPEIDILVDTSRLNTPVPEILLKPQVFNIPENNYVYPDAKAVCSAYGGRLATYKEVEAAYNSGAEWCNYGWTEGQMALFPTQEKSYNELQKIKGHENDCGRQGVNGGYMANPA